MKIKQIIKARARVLSLLPKGANLMPTVYKSREGDFGDSFQVVGLMKEGPEEGELLNVVYVPDMPDAHGHWMTKAAIKDMAHAAGRDGMEIDLYHDGKKLGPEQAFIAEQFLVNKGDTRFQGWKDDAGRDVNLEGAFATVMKIEDPALRERVKKGELAQVSFEGPALIEKSREGGDDGTIKTLLKTLLKAVGLGTHDTNETEPEMKKEEIEALVAEAVQKALKPADQKPKDGDNTPDVDLNDVASVKKHLADLEEAKGPDLSDIDAVKKHLAKLEAESLRKGVDFNDPKQVTAYLEKLQKAQGEDADTDTDTDTDGDEGDDSEIFDDGDEDLADVPDAVKKRLQAAERRSNRTPSAKDTEEKELYKGFSPKIASQMRAGSRMAAYINAKNGVK